MFRRFFAKNTLHSIAAVCAVFLCGAVWSAGAWGTDYWWKSTAADTVWTNTNNWETGSSGSGSNSGTYPSSSSDSAFISVAASYYPDVASVLSLSSLTVTSGTSSFTGGITATGAIALGGSSVTLAGTVSGNSVSISAPATLTDTTTISGTATITGSVTGSSYGLTLSDDTTFGDGSTTVAASGIAAFSVTAGKTVTVNSDYSLSCASMTLLASTSSYTTTIAGAGSFTADTIEITGDGTNSYLSTLAVSVKTCTISTAVYIHTGGKLYIESDCTASIALTEFTGYGTTMTTTLEVAGTYSGNIITCNTDNSTDRTCLVMADSGGTITVSNITNFGTNTTYLTRSITGGGTITVSGSITGNSTTPVIVGMTVGGTLSVPSITDCTINNLGTIKADLITANNVTNTGELTYEGSACAISCTGVFYDTGTATGVSVTLKGTAAQSFTPGSSTYTAVTVNNTGSTDTASTVTLYSALTCGTLTVTDGVLSAGSNKVTATGTLVNNSSIISAGGDIIAGGAVSGSGLLSITGAATVTATSGGTIAALTATAALSLNGGTDLTVTSYTGGTGVALTTKGSVTFESDVSVSTFTITDGSVTSSKKFTVSGSWLNSGTFSNSSSSVVFTGTTTAVISGNNTWGTFSCTAVTKTIQFTADSEQKVTTLTIAGSGTSNRVTLCSTISGSIWTITVPTADASVTYAKVQDSVSTNASIKSTSSVSGGHNTNWIFTETYTWTGKTSTVWALASNWVDTAGNIDTGYPGLSGGDTAIIPTTPTGSSTTFPILTLSADLTITSLTINSSASFTLADSGSYNLVLSGTLTNYGTINYAGSGRIVNLSSTAINDVSNSGTVAYVGTSDGMITDFASGTSPDYYNLTIAGSGTFSNNTATIVVAGSLTTGTNAVVNSLAELSVAGASSIGANVTTTGAQTYGGVITGSTFTLTGTTININGGTVTTTGSQTYSGAVMLGASTTFTANNGGTVGTVTFSSTLQGALSGKAVAFGTGTTAANQTNVSFGGIVGGSGYISTVIVYGTTAFGSGCTAVTSTGAQSYTRDATLGNALVCTAYGTSAQLVKFGGTVSGAYALTIGTSSAKASNVQFGDGTGTDTVGTLESLLVYGTTAFGASCASVSTTGTQTYYDTATLNGNTVFLAGTSLVTFGNLIDSGNSTGYSLTVGNNLNTTPVSFAGAIGGTQALSALTVYSGSAAINGGAITTTGAQTYGGTVTSTAATLTLTSTTSGGISFANTVLASSTDKTFVLSSASGSVTQTSSTAVITAKNLLLEGASTFTLTAASNNIGTVAAASGTGAISLANSAALTVGSVTDASSTITKGIASTGTVSLTTAAGDLTVTQPISSTGGNITLNPTGTIYLNYAGTVLSLLGVSSSYTLTLDSPVVLGAATTITTDGTTYDSAVSFSGAITNSTAQTLLITSGTANVTFFGSVGSVTALTSLSVTGGTLYVNGGSVAAATQTYSANVTPASATATTFTGSVTLANGKAFTGGTALSTFAGDVTNNGTVSAGTGGITFTGFYTGSSGTLSNNSTGGITFTHTGTAAYSVTVGTYTHNSGLLTFGGAGTGTVTFIPGSSTYYSVTVNKTGSGAVVAFGNNPFSQESASSFTITSGTVTVGNNIFVAGAMSLADGAIFTQTGYNSSTGTLSGTVYTQSAASISLAGSSSKMNWDNGDAGGTLSLAGTISNASSGTLNFHKKNIVFTQTVTLGNAVFYDLIIANTGSVTLNGDIRVRRHVAVAGTYIPGSYTLTLGNASPGLTGGTSSASTGDSVSGGVAVIGSSTSSLGTVVVYQGTTQKVLGANPLIGTDYSSYISTAGSFPCTSLTLSDTQTGAVSINNGMVTTLSDTMTSAPLGINTLAAANRISTTTSFATTITTSAFGTGAAGVLTFGTIAGDSVAFTNGLTLPAQVSSLSVSGSVYTAGNAMSISRPVVLAGGSGVTDSFDTTNNGSSSSGAAVSFSTANGKINAATAGSESLSVKAGAGSVTFDAAIGSLKPLSSVSVTSTGTINVNGGSVESTGTQTYTGAVSCGADTLFKANSGTAASAVTFKSTVISAVAGYSLSFGTGAAATGATNAVFNDDVGGTTFSTISIYGTSLFNKSLSVQSVASSGLQTYTGAVTLDDSYGVTLTSGSAAVDDGITFTNTIDSSTGNNYPLIISCDGVVTFAGNVGGVSSLSTLTTQKATAAAGIVLFNSTGAISAKTTGLQTYGGAVQNGAVSGMTLSSSSTAGINAVTFNGTVDSVSGKNYALTISTTGVTTFGDSDTDYVGNTDALSTLSIGGTSVINCGKITTALLQTYTGAVTVTDSSGVTFKSAAASGSNAVTFSSTLNSLSGNNYGVTVAADGITTFAGSVGATDALSTLTTQKATAAAGIVLFNSTGVLSVKTTGLQTYGGAVQNGAVSGLTLSSSSTAGINAVTFNGTVDSVSGKNYALTISTVGVTTFGDADNDYVGSVSSPSTLTVEGASLINTGKITTVDAQTYTGAVTLGSNAVALTVTGISAADRIVFTSGISGTPALTLTSAAGGVLFNGTSDSTWNVTGGITCTALSTNIFLDGVGSTLTLSCALSCQNFYFYRGTLLLNSGTITTSKDFVVWGSGYSADDPRYTNTDTRFAYYRTDSIHYYPAGGTYSNGVFDTTPSSAFDSASSGTITVGENFYNNGAAMSVSAISLKLPANSSSSPVFNSSSAVTSSQWGNPYAVAFNMIVKNVSASCYSSSGSAYVAAGSYAYDGTTVGTDVVAQKVTNGTGNTNWQFYFPQIVSAETVYDDVLKVTFNIPLENSNGEINAIINSSYAAVANGGMWYDNTNTAKKFAHAYADADCTAALGDAPTVVYLRTTTTTGTNSSAATTWNTDATGSAAYTNGTSAYASSMAATVDTDCTNRSGNHSTVIPNLSFLEGNVYASDGHSMCRNYGTGIENGTAQSSSDTYASATDACDPVLVAVRTGQEMHIVTIASQTDADAHNFIEFHYSEPVDIGTSLTATGGAVNRAASSTLGDVSGTSGITIAGLATTESGAISTGTTGAATNSLYRMFATVAAATDAANISALAVQTNRVRVSIAGYVDGTVTVGSTSYKKWIGYIASAKNPSGTVVRVSNTELTDSKSNELDATGSAANHTLPTLYVNSTNITDLTASTYTDTSSATTLYGTWDTSAPSFAPFRANGSVWTSSPSYYEAVGTATSGSSYLDRIEFHMFDNLPEYMTSEVEWFSKMGWYTENTADNTYNAVSGYAADVYGGSRKFNTTNRTSGGIRYCTLYNAYGAFKYTTSPSGTPDTLFASTTITGGADSALFLTATGSTASGTQNDMTSEDGLYFAVYLTNTTIPLKTTFIVGFDYTSCYLTDLAGNRIQTDYSIPTVNRTPPDFNMTVSPAGQNQLYIVFSKRLADTFKWYTSSTVSETRDTLVYLPQALIITTGSGTNIAVDTATPATFVFRNDNATGVLVTLTKNTVLTDIVGNLYVDVSDPGTSYDPLTGIEAHVTYIQDNIGNYITVGSEHAFSDFAVNIINPQYAYDNRMTDDDTDITSGLYKDGSWAVHDWSTDQGNYGTLLADHDIFISSNLYDGTTDNSGGYSSADKYYMYWSVAPDADSVSTKYNTNSGSNWRVWLPNAASGIFTNLAPANNNTYTTFTGGVFPDETSLPNVMTFSLPVTTDSTAYASWKAGSQVRFLFGLMNNSGTAYTVKHGGSSDTAMPLYALRTSTSNIWDLDLWSFKLKDAKSQRGGVTILNNVINVNVKEQTVIEVNMSSAGNLNVYVMTLDGNIVKRLEHNRVSKGLHYYRWDGTNNAGNAVARGLYFVRVVAADIDEMRKVMCVKE
jgi:hypothetical protein